MFQLWGSGRFVCNKILKFILAHFICSLQNYCVCTFLLKPEILCLLFKKFARSKILKRAKKLVISDNLFVPYNILDLVRNHVKLIHVVNSRRGFSKGAVLCGGY